MQLYEKLGSHPMTVDGVEGTYFAVWAPDAVDVTVVGDFNYWTPCRHFLGARTPPESGRALSSESDRERCISIISSPGSMDTK